METRRVVFSISVLYETSIEKLKEIPNIIKRIIEEQPGLKFDRAHFSSFGSSSLDFEIVYFVSNPDYNLYMDKQQRINLAIFEEFENENIGFAYHTQKIYIDQLTDGNSGGLKCRTVN